MIAFSLKASARPLRIPLPPCAQNRNLQDRQRCLTILGNRNRDGDRAFGRDRTDENSIGVAVFNDEHPDGRVPSLVQILACSTGHNNAKPILLMVVFPGKEKCYADVTHCYQLVRTRFTVGVLGSRLACSRA